MHRVTVICAIAILVGIIPLHERPPSPIQPDAFVIGVQTFFDFGPPFNYYEIFVVHPNGNGSSLDRITLTPPGDACLVPTKIEVVSTSVAESPAALLGEVNPCAVPEKDLRRELKRCKKCLVFSGANTAMQVQCQDQTRILRSDILDKDMFAVNPDTPKHTSWTMHLLTRLDRELGPGLWTSPRFLCPTSQKPLRRTWLPRFFKL